MYADGPMDTFSGMRTEVKYKPQLIEAVTHPVTITVARSFAGIPVDLEKPWKVVVKLSYVSWEMPVRIRLARPPHRTKLTTHYHIVAIDGRKRRDAKPIEVLGVYDPVPRLPDEATKPWTIEDALPGRKKVELKPQKKIEWSVERLKYWLSVGAQPSKTVETLLEKVRNFRNFKYNFWRSFGVCTLL